MRDPRRLRADNDAVSPVVGTILMVAIVVVLAVGVLVMVQVVDTPDPAPPSQGIFARDDQADRIDVQRGDAAISWQQLEIRADTVGVQFAKNAESGLGSTPLTTTAMAVGAGNVMVNDFLDFCGTLGPVADATITLTDSDANLVLFSKAYESIAACV